jgi:transcriptional regulator with XRE-family HTH domain
MSDALQVGQKDPIAIRLGEERVRLRMNQGQLAVALNVSRASVNFYEAGKHLPGADVLVKLHEIGADILYILTGQHARNAPLDLNRFELALVEANRQSLTNDEQLNQRELLDRAWVIYQALTSFMAVVVPPTIK